MYKKMIIILAVLPFCAQAQWGVGFGVDNADSLYEGYIDDARASLGIQYRSERFNLLPGFASLKLWHNPRWQLEAVAQAQRGYDSAGNNRLSDQVLGMNKRKTGVGLGARGVLKTSLLELSAQYVADVTQRNKGQAAEFRIGNAPYMPAWGGQRELELNLFAGLRWQDEKFNSYYYGVQSHEATASRSAHTLKSAHAGFIGLQARAQMNQRFTIESNISVESVPDTIRNSPITEDKKHQTRFDLLLSYWF